MENLRFLPRELWHYLLALVTAVVYKRIAQTLSGAGGHTKTPRTLVMTDAFGLVLLLSYSTLLIVLKQSVMSLVISKTVLGMICLISLIHVVMTAYLSRRVWVTCVSSAAAASA